MNKKLCLCGCLSEVSLEELIRYLNHPQVDLLEWRLDLFLQHYPMQKILDMLPALNSSVRHPILVTNRPKSQGGAFEGSEELRLEELRKVVEWGAEWVDIESEAAEEMLSWVSASETQVVLSHHDFSETPEDLFLHKKIEEMAGRKPQIIKIATYANQPEDNLRILELIPFARHEFDIDVIAFCMGPLGQWSRVASLLLGSPWTYAQLPGQSPTAPGQLTAEQMRTILESLT